MGLTSTSLPVPINASTTPAPDSLSNLDVISLSTENQLREDFLSLARTGKVDDYLFIKFLWIIIYICLLEALIFKFF